jgi:excisionase family DNA binding protein
MLTVRAVAQRLSCSTQTVRNLIRTGRLPAHRRLGTARGAWQITETDLAEFLGAAADRQPSGAVA